MFEFLRARVLEREIDIEFVALVGVMHALNLASLGRDDLGFRASVLERFARFGHFDLFKSVGD